MIKNYEYELSTINLVHFKNIKHLFEVFNIFYKSLAYTDEDTKIYKILYSEADIDACTKKDEFLNLLEDLALLYNL